jgi:hypothetical protein
MDISELMSCERQITNTPSPLNTIAGAEYAKPATASSVYRKPVLKNMLNKAK